MKLPAQPVGPDLLIYLLSSQASSSDFGILYPPLGNASEGFALSQRGVARINTPETADGEIAGADLGQEGGGQLEVTDIPPFSSSQRGTECFSPDTHISLSNSAEIRLVSSSGDFGSSVYLTTGGGQDVCNGKLNSVVSLWN